MVSRTHTHRQRAPLSVGEQQIVSKVSKDLGRDIVAFKTKLAGLSFGESLDDILALVPPRMLQHIPQAVFRFRSYLTRFQRGSSPAVAFVKWYEWASFEASKSGNFRHGGRSEAHRQEHGEADEGDNTVKEVKRVTARSETKTAMGRIAKERTHMRALLAMCERHNSTRRHEGVRALVNHMRGHLSDVPPCHEVAALKEATHHSVSYALQRLVLGMATENFAMAMLNCHALSVVLSQGGRALTAGLLIDLIDTELSMTQRLRASESRWAQNAKKPSGDDQENSSGDDEEAADSLDVDATQGERNQSTMAAAMAIAALLASTSDGLVLRTADAARLAKILSFCYIEHRGLRMLSGNLLLRLLTSVRVADTNDGGKAILSTASTATAPAGGGNVSAMAVSAVLHDPAALRWIEFAFFKFPKLDYVRPEGVQLLMAFAEAHLDGIISHSAKQPSRLLPSAIVSWLPFDPLEPRSLEQMAAALFRREQVTVDCHPTIHPVWAQLRQLVVKRSAAGESATVHITNIVHNVCAPYRRGAADSPRQALFQHLVHELGQLGLKATDAAERKQIVAEVQAVGFGKRRALGRSSTPQELRQMSLLALGEKCDSLIHQLLGSRTERGGAIRALRTWCLRELKACLAVEVRPGLPTPYVDRAAEGLFAFAFERFPSGGGDMFNQQKAAFIFVDLITAPTPPAAAGTSTGTNSRFRPRPTVSFAHFATLYVKIEAAGKTSWLTAVHDSVFAKARASVLAALEDSGSALSVLFFDCREASALLFVIFLILSVDDPSNEVARGLAETSVLDFVGFYRRGTLETIEVLFDVLMSFAMRPVAAMQVQPLMAAARRISITLMARFARHIRTRSALDLVLAPLVEAFDVDARAAARAAAGGVAGKGGDADSDAHESEDDHDEDQGQASAEGSASDGATENDEDAAASTCGDGTEDDDGTEADGGADSDGSTDVDDEAALDAEFEADDANEMNDEFSGASEDDDPEKDMPDGEAYLRHIETMLATIDSKHPSDPSSEAAATGRPLLLHHYPTDTAAHEKGDAVRSITIATRITLQMRSPLVLRTMQVLLCAMRENVKESDEVLFNAARSAVEMLLLSRQRYFGHFLAADSATLLGLLGDIVGYCRKQEFALLAMAAKADRDKQEGGRSANFRTLVKRRLESVKRLALTVFHFAAFLAPKNHASEGVRAVFAEHYRTLFADRGWDQKRRMPQLMADMYHYRHAFAWVILDAVTERFARSRHIDSARRAVTFRCACEVICGFLPRFKGLPEHLRDRAATVIRSFLSLMPPAAIYEMHNPVLFEYARVLKISLEYQRKTQLDIDWARETVTSIIDDDAVQITGATARHLARCEEHLQMTPRVLQIKPAVPQLLLHKQHSTAARRDAQKRSRVQHAKKRERATASLLSDRNQEPTFQQRVEKKERRAELKAKDRAARAALRESHWSSLTKEEKSEKRSKARQAKQVRIQRNKDHKKQMLSRRNAAFVEWRQAKLKAAGAPKRGPAGKKRQPQKS